MKTNLSLDDYYFINTCLIVHKWNLEKQNLKEVEETIKEIENILKKLAVMTTTLDLMNADRLHFKLEQWHGNWNFVSYLEEKYKELKIYKDYLKLNDCFM